MATNPAEVKSGAAGAAQFVDSDSRKYRYFEPRGKRATHYEDMTVDVQPDPERYLMQDWIISFPDGKGAYVKENTAALSSNWHAFRAPDQEWERTHYQRQSTIEGMIQNVVQNARRAGAPKGFDKAWVKVLQNHLGAWKHAEFGLGTSLMQAQRYGYTQMINNAVLTNSSATSCASPRTSPSTSPRSAWTSRASTTRPARSAWMENDDLDADARSRREHHGLGGLSRAVFRHQYLLRAVGRRAVPLGLRHAGGAFQPGLRDACRGLRRRGRLRPQPRELHRPHLPAARTTRSTPSTTRRLFEGWLKKHVALGRKAAQSLQPIWSQPHGKPIQFTDAQAQSEERLKTITSQLGLSLPK